MTLNWEEALNHFEEVIASADESTKLKAISKFAHLSDSAPEDILIRSIPIFARVLDDCQISSNSISIQQAAAYCLKKMASLGDARMAIEIGESSVILSILRLLPQSETTLESVLVKCLLSLVTFGSKNREIVARNGGLEMIIDKLSSCSDDSIRKYLLETLSTLTLLVEVRRRLVGLRGLRFLIEAARFGSMVSRERACQAIGLVGIARRSRRMLVELGAIPVLVELFCNGDDWIRLVVGNSLGVISAHVAHIRLVGESGAIPLYIGLLEGRDPTGRDIAEDVICILAVAEENAVQIAGQLVRILREGGDEAKAAAADVLWDLAGYKHSLSVIRNSGAIPLLVDLLSNGSDEVREKASGAIAQLSYNEGDRVEFAETGAVPLLIELLRDESEEVRDNAAEAVVNLYEDPKFCERISGAVDVESLQTMRVRINRIRVSDEHMARSFRRMSIQQLTWTPDLL